MKRRSGLRATVPLRLTYFLTYETRSTHKTNDTSTHAVFLFLMYEFWAWNGSTDTDFGHGYNYRHGYTELGDYGNYGVIHLDGSWAFMATAWAYSAATLFFTCDFPLYWWRQCLIFSYCFCDGGSRWQEWAFTPDEIFAICWVYVPFEGDEILLRFRGEVYGSKLLLMTFYAPLVFPLGQCLFFCETRLELFTDNYALALIWVITMTKAKAFISPMNSKGHVWWRIYNTQNNPYRGWRWQWPIAEIKGAQVVRGSAPWS